MVLTHPVNHELQIDVVVFKLHEIDLLETSLKLSGELGCILGANTE